MPENPERLLRAAHGVLAAAATMRAKHEEFGRGGKRKPG
jgi:hypothetical protein